MCFLFDLIMMDWNIKYFCVYISGTSQFCHDNNITGYGINVVCCLLQLTGSRLPVHVISYNCTDPETIRFLKDMARITGGKYAYIFI